jgi:hypothetical protein
MPWRSTPSNWILDVVKVEEVLTGRQIRDRIKKEKNETVTARKVSNTILWKLNHRFKKIKEKGELIKFERIW